MSLIPSNQSIDLACSRTHAMSPDLRCKPEASWMAKDTSATVAASFETQCSAPLTDLESSCTYLYIYNIQYIYIYMLYIYIYISWSVFVSILLVVLIIFTYTNFVVLGQQHPAIKFTRSAIQEALRSDFVAPAFNVRYQACLSLL